jgi:hypothetical protein
VGRVVEAQCHKLPQQHENTKETENEAKYHARQSASSGASSWKLTRTGQDRTGQDRTGQDRTGQDG